MSEITIKSIEKHLENIEKNLANLKKIYTELELSRNILRDVVDDIMYPADLKKFLKDIYNRDRLDYFIYGAMFKEIRPKINLNEKLSFENFIIEKIDFDTNTVWIIAGGDWKSSFRFSATLKNSKGRWEYNNDLEEIDDELYDLLTRDDIIKKFSEE